MDRISSADGILWLGIAAVVVCLLPVLLTVLVWACGERLSTVFHRIGLAAAAVLLAMNLDILLAAAAPAQPFTRCLPFGWGIALLGAAGAAGSAALWNRDRTAGKALFTGAMLAEWLLLFGLVWMKG